MIRHIQNELGLFPDLEDQNSEQLKLLTDASIVFVQRRIKEKCEELDLSEETKRNALERSEELLIFPNLKELKKHQESIEYKPTRREEIFERLRWSFRNGAAGMLDTGNESKYAVVLNTRSGPYKIKMLQHELEHAVDFLLGLIDTTQTEKATLLNSISMYASLVAAFLLILRTPELLKFIGGQNTREQNGQLIAYLCIAGLGIIVAKTSTFLYRQLPHEVSANKQMQSIAPEFDNLQL